MLLASAAVACSREEQADVVAAFFPLAEAVRETHGPDGLVTLTPPGVEPHDVELSTKQIDQIQNAKFVVLLGGGFQPAVERAARRADGKVVTIPVDGDPHIWLDPLQMRDIVRQVAQGLDRPATGEPFMAELQRVHDEYEAGLRTCDRRTLITAHDAFGHVAKRYRLETAPITGISPEAEPDPRRLAELTDLARRTGTTTIFTEELVSPKVAEALAREAGVRTDVLDTLESGEPGTLVEAMRENLKRLRAALGCR